MNCPLRLSEKVWALIDSLGGLLISNDTTLQIDGYDVLLQKIDTISNAVDSPFVLVPNTESTLLSASPQSFNSFQEDQQTSYLFFIKKLGWANIDRLFQDPRTKEIDLVVQVENFGDYDKIFTSMIFKAQNMYLPGYQKKDNSFSFIHGDFEKTNLPVGETATILVTAYIEEQPYYAIQTFEIKEKETIELNLYPISKEELKKEIEEKI